jgi:hypothetical protein
MKLDELLGALLPRGREAIAWAQVIAILVIGRLCEPSSELHVTEQWYRTMALEDLLSCLPSARRFRYASNRLPLRAVPKTRHGK